MSYDGPIDRPPLKPSEYVRKLSDEEREEIQKAYDKYMDEKHKEHYVSLFMSYVKRMF